jgi:hypothetical protein
MPSKYKFYFQLLFPLPEMNLNAHDGPVSNAQSAPASAQGRVQNAYTEGVNYSTLNSVGVSASSSSRLHANPALSYGNDIGIDDVQPSPAKKPSLRGNNSKSAPSGPASVGMNGSYAGKVFSMGANNASLQPLNSALTGFTGGTGPGSSSSASSAATHTQLGNINLGSATTNGALVTGGLSGYTFASLPTAGNKFAPTNNKSKNSVATVRNAALQPSRFLNNFSIPAPTMEVLPQSGAHSHAYLLSSALMSGGNGGNSSSNVPVDYGGPPFARGAAASNSNPHASSSSSRSSSHGLSQKLVGNNNNHNNNGNSLG